MYQIAVIEPCNFFFRPKNQNHIHLTKKYLLSYFNLFILISVLYYIILKTLIKQNIVTICKCI